MRTGQLPQGVEWAVHLCLVLALLTDDELLPAARLAELFDLPAAYLAKTLQELAGAGIIVSVSGRRGGYRLAAAPHELPVGRIVRATGLRKPLFQCTEIRQRGPYGADPADCRAPCGVSALMHRAQAAYLAVLDATPLSELAIPGGRAGAEGWLTANVHRTA